MNVLKKLTLIPKLLHQKTSNITMEKMFKFGRVFAIAASLPLKHPLQKPHCEGQHSPTFFLHHQRDWNTFASPGELAQQAKD